MMPLSQSDQFGSMRIFNPAICTKNEAWPIQVMPIWSCARAGKSGVVFVPASRGDSSDGRRTSVRKLRLCQPFSSFTPTRMAGLAAAKTAVPSAGFAPSEAVGGGATTGARRRLRLPPAAAIF